MPPWVHVSALILCKRLGGVCCCAFCIVFTALFIYYVLPVIVGTSIANLFTG